jgi:hypothetical protein
VILYYGLRPSLMLPMAHKWAMSHRLGTAYTKFDQWRRGDVIKIVCEKLLSAETYHTPRKVSSLISFFFLSFNANLTIILYIIKVQRYNYKFNIIEKNIDGKTIHSPMSHPFVKYATKANS